jgi:hypothetical protein
LRDGAEWELVMNPEPLYWLLRIDERLIECILTPIDIPYKDKDEVKEEFSAKWCKEKKTWFLVGKYQYEKFKRYMAEKRKSSWEFSEQFI